MCAVPISADAVEAVHRRSARIDHDACLQRNPGDIVQGAGKDDQVVNKARVTVKNGSDQFTNVPSNPLNPRKDEVSPGDGEGVVVGEEIEYRITWLNDAYKDNAYQKAGVIITDVLDPGVDFVKAGFIDRDGNRIDSLDGCVAVYFPESHTVKWTLPDRDPKAHGEVYLIVRVNENAFDDYHYNESEDKDHQGDIVKGTGQDDQVVNKARVTVENGSDQYTDVPKNPVKERKPDNPDNPKVPKTVDDSHLGLWMTLLVLCLSGLAEIVFYTVKKKPARFDRKKKN